MNMPKEKRTRQVIFRVTDSEWQEIRQRMDSLGVTNIAAFLRKMAIDGYILQLDLPELKELLSLMRYAGNNINQIAKVAHTNGTIRESDLQTIQSSQQEMWKLMNRILIRLGEID